MAHDSRVQGYRLPRVPTVKAPIAEATSERLKMTWSKILLVANAEITTVTGRMSAIEDIIDIVGTITNCTQNGRVCKHQEMAAGR